MLIDSPRNNRDCESTLHTLIRGLLPGVEFSTLGLLLPLSNPLTGISSFGGSVKHLRMNLIDQGAWQQGLGIQLVLYGQDGDLIGLSLHKGTPHMGESTRNPHSTITLSI